MEVTFSDKQGKDKKNKLGGGINWKLGLTYIHTTIFKMDFPVAQTVKNLPAMRETQVPSLGREDPLEKEMATHSSIFAWEIPWKFHGQRNLVGYSP